MATTRLFHGTRPDAVPSIRQEGLRPPPGTGPTWFMLTTSREQAARYSNGGVVLEFEVPNEVIYGSDEYERGSDKAVLWNAWPHTCYDFDAEAYAVKTVLPAKYLVGVTKTAKTASGTTTVYRGVSVELDDYDDVPASLVRQVTSGTGTNFQHGIPMSGAGAGVHWTTDKRVAQNFSAPMNLYGETKTISSNGWDVHVPVVLTAQVDSADVVTSIEELRDAMVEGHGWEGLPNPDRLPESEVLVRRGAQVRVTEIEAASPAAGWGRVRNAVENMEAGNVNGWKCSWKRIGGGMSVTASSPTFKHLPGHTVGDAGIETTDSHLDLLVAYEGGRPVGWIGWMTDEGWTKGAVDVLYVEPPHRHQGLATELLVRAQEIEPDVDPHNTPWFTDDGAAWMRSIGSKTAAGTQTVRVYHGTNQASAGSKGTIKTAADYWMSHRPTEDGPPAHDLLAVEMLPSDVYEHPEFYTGFRQFLPEVMRVLREVRGNPSATVTIYRAQPTGSGLNSGDWVSLSRAYAELDQASEPEGRSVESYRVPASTVHHAGDDMMEWGYFGSPIRGRTASKIASTALENVISVAEMRIEARGQGGQQWRLSRMHVDDPGWKAAHDPVEKFVRQVLASEGVTDLSIRVYLTTYGMDGTVAQTDGLNYIQVGKEQVSTLTLLHECAHIINRTSEGEGHDRRFVEVAARLYTRYLSADTGSWFVEMTSLPEVGTKASSKEYPHAPEPQDGVLSTGCIFLAAVSPLPFAT